MCGAQAARSGGTSHQPEHTEMSFLRRGAPHQCLRGGRMGQVKGRGEDIAGIRAWSGA